MRPPFRVLPILFGALLTASPLAQAQTATTAGTGFQINRYEPTAAGEWSFWVDHPWYASTRSFAAGLSLNYAHNPLIFGLGQADGSFARTNPVVAHQLLAHVDLAGSFLDRVLVTLSLPVVLVEQGGTPSAGVAAGEQPSVGDLRLGAMVRLWGQPYRSPLSVSAGGSLWIPFRQAAPDGLPPTDSDTAVRGALKVALGGLHGELLWSLTAGLLLRPHASLGDPGLGAEANSELQLGAAVAWAKPSLRLAVGPELLVSTAVTGDNALTAATTNIEALFGVHYNLANLVQLGVGGGVGILRQAGTPDGRFLFRLAYAPWPKPASDRDHDGVIDSLDLCPDAPKGPEPDPRRPGCPREDRDHDGIYDDDDLCPDEPQGPVADCGRRGCPAGDRDQDGVLDRDDLCPDEAQGALADPDRRGCPARDRDHDLVPDAADACPDTAGVPSGDPRLNGCPSLVSVADGQLILARPVFFATAQDVILEESYPVLEAVAGVLKTSAQLKKVRIEGHTDDRGRVAGNTRLSARRASSVAQWLIGHGVAAERLEATGYGPTRPIADNTTEEGRAKNRRVDFVIIDPPLSAAARPAGDAPQAAPSPPAPGPTGQPAPAAAPAQAEARPEGAPAPKEHRHRHHHHREHAGPASKPTLSQEDPRPDKEPGARPHHHRHHHHEKAKAPQAAHQA